MIERVHRWWYQWKVTRRLSKLARRIDRTHAKLDELHELAKSQQRSFAKANRALLQELERARSEFAEIEQHVDRVQVQMGSYRTEVTDLREELDVLNKVTVPQLTKANDLMLQRWNRFISEEVRLQSPAPKEML